MDIEFLEKKSAKIRENVINLIYNAKTGHTGSDLSCADILVALYYGVMKVEPKNPEWDKRDRYVQSKGHAVEDLWCILEDKGFISQDKLNTYGKFNTELIGHPNNNIDGIEMNTGSLGHGLPLAVGMALSAKKHGQTHHVYTLMGDGEQAEGSVWEAAMAASNFKLDNLTAIIDNNGLQITGPTTDVMNSEPLRAKYESFGWNVIEVDGNNMRDLISALTMTPMKNKSTLILAHTVKGKGLPVAENKAEWHHKVPTEEQVEEAMTNLDKILK